MEAYLSPLEGTGEEVERISVEDTIGVYLNNLDDLEVYATVEGREIKLGRDSTVSRRQNGRSPVQFIKKENGVEIQNNGNSNGISVDTGVKNLDISENESYLATTSATVHIGYSTELRLTIEQNPTRTLDRSELEDLGLEGDGPIVQGVNSAVYVQAVADNLRQASERSPNDVLKYATELHNFVHEQPVDSTDYEDLESNLAKMVNRLESKVSRGSLRGSGLDEEWIEEIDRIAHQAERLYSRID